MANRNIYLNGVYDKNNPSWHSEDASWKAGQILKMIFRNGIKVTKVADIGCGSGMVIKYLSEDLHQTTKLDGFDVSPYAIKKCQKIKDNNINFYHKDFVKCKKNNHYDLILVIDVIEHLENYSEFLTGLRSRGKYKIFNIPLDLSAQMILRSTPLLKLRKRVGHLHYFTKYTAIAVLEESGYKIIDSFYAPSSHELPDRPLRMRLLSPFRRILFLINQDFAVRLLGGYSLVVLAR